MTDLDHSSPHIGRVVELFTQPVQIGRPIHGYIFQFRARGTAHPLCPEVSALRMVSSQRDAYVKAGVHCCGSVKISDDALQSASRGKVSEERRMLPMHDPGHDQILEVICDVFNILSIGRWYG